MFEDTLSDPIHCVKRDCPPNTARFEMGELPEGWRVLEGALCAPRGYAFISNGKSRFGDEYENALLKLEEE